MLLKKTFPSHAVDYFGYISPNVMMREVNDALATQNVEDGAGFARIMTSIGATWMLGQCVLEFDDLVNSAEELEIEALPRENFGISYVRRAVAKRDGKVVVRYAAKQLPVYVETRKIVPVSVMDRFWKEPAAPCGENIPFIQPIANMQPADYYTVRYYDCDPNRHLTAFRYLDIILEAMAYWCGEVRRIQRIQIDYRSECVPGDSLLLTYGEQDGVHYITGTKQNGKLSFNSTVRLSEETYPISSQREGFEHVPV